MALLLAKKRRYVFLISHMRSYSSLLGHILGSNPQIAGYAETHHSYRSDLDLVELALKIYHTNNRSLDGDILFDKVLHGQYEFSDRFLGRDDVSLLFAIREPVATVRSTVAMARRRKKPDWKGDVQKVSDYYMRRLDQMVHLAGRQPAHSAFLVADDLIHRTSDVLASLTEFLDLRVPLTSEYQTFEYTGKPIYGDPGAHIKAGSVVRDRDDHSEVEVDEEIQRRLKQAYEEAVQELSRLCQVKL